MSCEVCVTGSGLRVKPPTENRVTWATIPRRLAAFRMSLMSSERVSVTSQASRGSGPGEAWFPSIITRIPSYSTRSPAGANRGEFMAPTPVSLSRKAMTITVIRYPTPSWAQFRKLPSLENELSADREKCPLPRGASPIVVVAQGPI